jgi:hypothetical protein
VRDLLGHNSVAMSLRTPTWHPTRGARRSPSSTRSHSSRLQCAYSGIRDSRAHA